MICETINCLMIQWVVECALLNNEFPQMYVCVCASFRFKRLCKLNVANVCMRESTHRGNRTDRRISLLMSVALTRQ